MTTGSSFSARRALWERALRALNEERLLHWRLIGIAA
jgi:hypothetical protein